MHAKLKQWINWVGYDELMERINNAPQKLLGNHSFGKGQVFTAYRPKAKAIWVVDEETGKETPMEAVEDEGFFGLYLSQRTIERYQLKIKYDKDDVIVIRDPYCFENVISELDRYLFAEGTHNEIYKKLGAHLMTIDGVEGTHFAVWAPNARSVSVVGDFNMWDGRLHPMKLLDVSGIYELFVPGVGEGGVYKFEVCTRKGDVLLKADPYANHAELRPGTASIIAVVEGRYHWRDAKWMEARGKRTRNDARREKMAIYEVHLGSWKKKDDGTEDGFYNYRELAAELGDYVKEMGFTHVELIGVAEYPFDASWGYQVTGYYAPTSRYGTPEDFMYFVDHMHGLGLQVILDWVPAHFPKDGHGLAKFDGVPLYEHSDPRRGEHPHWGTLIFDYSRNEVENFLIANALFWAKEYHVDGLRVDAVASMLYLDYGKSGDEWLPNEQGGNKSFDAVHMIRRLNETVEELAPGFMMIAEESTSWEGVTAPVSQEGLGFLFKWNMGWMNDFLEYMKMDPFFRSNPDNHAKLCFSLMYAYSENFIQVLSHDEVVHGKGTMVNKMPGDKEQRFANVRLAYGFMYGHPGKKLLFMGQEFAQEREWSERRELDWNLLQVDGGRQNYHKEMQEYVKALNRIYNKYSALSYNDQEKIGFEWIDCHDMENSTVSFIRRGDSKKDHLLFLCNFIPVDHPKFTVGVPCKGSYYEVLNSDAEEFGGRGRVNKNFARARKSGHKGREYSIEMHLPPLSVVVLRFDYDD